MGIVLVLREKYSLGHSNNIVTVLQRKASSNIGQARKDRRKGHGVFPSGSGIGIGFVNSNDVVQSRLGFLLQNQAEWLCQTKAIYAVSTSLCVWLMKYTTGISTVASTGNGCVLLRICTN